MPESSELYNEFVKLRAHVDELNKSVAVLTRFSPLKQEIVRAMSADPTLASVFLAVDGTRSQKEILDYLRSQGIPKVSRAGISRKLEVLCDEFDLVRATERTAKGFVYVHTDLARALKLERTLTKGSVPSRGNP